MKGLILCTAFPAMLMLVVGCTGGESGTAGGASVADQATMVAPGAATIVGDAGVVLPTAAPTVEASVLVDQLLGPGATTNVNGIAYDDTTIGTGPAVQACDFVGVTYTGRTSGGTPFEGSDAIGRPVRFAIGNAPPQAIAGLDQAVVGMQVGGSRTVVIPSEYTRRPDGYAVMPAVPQGEAVVLDVALEELTPAPSFPEMPDDVTYAAGEHGLEYAVLQEGTGDEVVAGDVVQIHYTGWLDDGDSAMDTTMQPAVGTCRPYVAALGQGEVIVGWDLGIPGMKVGERRQLRIPPSLAFGSAGFGNVPPDATLIFQMVLLSVE